MTQGWVELSDFPSKSLYNTVLEKWPANVTQSERLVLLTSTVYSHQLKWWRVTALHLVLPKCDNVTFSSIINLTQPSQGLMSLNIRMQSGRQKVKACLEHRSGYSSKLSQSVVLILCNSLKCTFWDDGKTYHNDGKIWRSLLAHIKQQHDSETFLLCKNCNHHHHHVGLQKKKKWFWSPAAVKLESWSQC